MNTKTIAKSEIVFRSKKSFNNLTTIDLGLLVNPPNDIFHRINILCGFMSYRKLKITNIIPDQFQYVPRAVSAMSKNFVSSIPVQAMIKKLADDVAQSVKVNQGSDAVLPKHADDGPSADKNK